MGTLLSFLFLISTTCKAQGIAPTYYNANLISVSTTPPTGGVFAWTIPVKIVGGSMIFVSSNVAFTNQSNTFTSSQTIADNGAGGLLVSGDSVTASAFFGDGSHLGGIPSTGSIVGVYVLKAGDTMTGQLTNTSTITITGFDASGNGLNVSSGIISGLLNVNGINDATGSGALSNSITAGNGFNNSSGSGSQGGAIVITSGGGGTATGTSGTIIGGNSGPITYQVASAGSATNSGTGAAVGGNGTNISGAAGAGGNAIATGSASGTGGNGGGYSLGAGTAGNATSSTSGNNTGGVGGGLTFTLRPGGNANNASGTNQAGNGGLLTMIAGAGGTADNGTSTTGGNGGSLTFNLGLGGHAGTVSAGSGTNQGGNGTILRMQAVGSGGAAAGGTTAIGGNGQTFQFFAGNGGAASGASGTNTAGNGGGFIFRVGNKGTSGTGGADGQFDILKNSNAQLFEVTTSSVSSPGNQFFIGTSTLQVIGGQVGIGVAPSSEFTVQSPTLTGSTDVVIISSNNATAILAINAGGHEEYKGTAPVISACGAAPAGSVVGNDNIGVITVGGGVVTACTMTFSFPWTNTAVCNVTDTNTSIGTAVTAASSSAVTIGASATIGGGTLYYRCSSYR